MDQVTVATMIRNAESNEVVIPVKTKQEIDMISNFLNEHKAHYRINFSSMEGTTIRVESTSDLKSTI